MNAQTSENFVNTKEIGWKVNCSDFWTILLRILSFRKEVHPWVYPAQALIVGENVQTDLTRGQAYIDEDNNIPFGRRLK